MFLVLAFSLVFVLVLVVGCGVGGFIVRFCALVLIGVMWVVLFTVDCFCLLGCRACCLLV